jgi:hypothetical protein
LLKKAELELNKSITDTIILEDDEKQDKRQKPGKEDEQSTRKIKP